MSIMKVILMIELQDIMERILKKKKIVCKILRIIKDNVELSLRRVTNKEKKEVMDSYQLEKRYESILKTILGEKTESTVKKIKESSSLSDFIKEIKENPKKLETLVGKNESQKIIEILGKEKQKKSFVKKEINLKSKKPNGLLLIKEIFNDASKKADQELQELIKEIERKSKKLGLEFSEKAKK